MSKAKRQAKKEVKEKKQVAKVQAKGEKKIAKVQKKQAPKIAKQKAKTAKKTAAKTGRVNKRAAGQQGRISNRQTATAQRQDKRKLNKGSRILGRVKSAGYGELSDENKMAVAEMAPYNDAMNEILADQGIEVENPEDVVETTMRYTMANPDITDPMESDDFNDAFINDDDYHDGEEEYEHFDWKAAAKQAAGAAMSSAGQQFSSYIDTLAMKQQNGLPLTPAEQKILDAKKKAQGVVKDEIMQKIKSAAPWVIVAILLILVLRKFA